jgi:hypothetical protein
MEGRVNPLTKLWEIWEGPDLLGRGETREQAEMSMPVKQAARKWQDLGNGELAPSGVELIDPDDMVTRRRRLYDVAKTQLQAVYPVSHGGLRMELADVEYEDPEDFGPEEQKQALLSDGSLSRRLRGTVRLVDEATAKPLDEKRLTLMRVPHLTDRGTFIDNGSEWTSILQSRLAPGAYTRRQANGELSTQFNTRPGTGRQFKVGFEPQTGQYRLKVGTANLHLYSMLHDMGVDDEDLATRWGPELLASNKAKYDKKVFGKAYERFVRPYQRVEGADDAAKREAIREALNKSQINDQIARRNLPNMFDMRKTASWRQAPAPVFDPDMTPAETVVEQLQQDLPDILIKLASFRPEELKAVASFIAQTTGVAIDLMGKPQDLEIQILQAIGAQPTTYNSAMMQAGTDLMDGLAKQAAFDPDFEPEDLGDAYNAIYGKAGPQLASMTKWPARWLHAQDPMGWLQWYEQYHAGRRTGDDERQIRRWERMKRFHGEAFKRKPTPRRGFALRYWAIDPLKLVDDPEVRNKAEADMQAYKAEAEAKWKKDHV